MDIRPATADDVPQVLPMVRKIAEMHEKLDPAKYAFRSDPGEMYRSWLASRSRDPRSVFLVADAGESLAGFLIGTAEDEIPIYQVENFGFIHDVWVEQDYRHEGIARQLVTLCIERFRDMGLKQIRCDTAWENQTARALFKRCGFRPSTVEMLIEL
ncbi:MAG TPA: GNAT family N-acetyltransferase [Tepidisphaeraceae bacterium]|jgi:ribosomal protein S18 acetylase RimI-like enzyme